VGVDSSTKLSPFLGLGVLSPRQVYHEIRALQAAQAPSSAVDSAANDEHAAAATPADGRRKKGVAAPGSNAEWLVMHLCIRCAAQESR
jgi:hypothetical protein